MQPSGPTLESHSARRAGNVLWTVFRGGRMTDPASEIGGRVLLVKTLLLDRFRMGVSV